MVKKRTESILFKIAAFLIQNSSVTFETKRYQLKL